MMNHRQILSALIVAGCLSASTSATAGIVPFTDKTAFLAAVQPGYYLESFDSLTPNTTYPDTMNLSQGSFSYTIFAQGSPPNDGLLAVEDPFLPGDIWLSANFDDVPMYIGNFTGGVSAVGGNFFLTNFDFDVIEALVTIVASDGVNTESVPIVVANPLDFVGFVTTDGSSVLSVQFAAPGFSNYATLNDLIVGQAITVVPEPSGFVMMAIGLGLAGAAIRKRRNRTS